VRHAAVPPKQAARALPTGLSDVRYVIGDEVDMARFRRDVVDTWVRDAPGASSRG
jgi:hypothetical protein